MGIFDSINPFANADEIACLKRANESTQVAMIDKMIDDLSKNWRPTGYYRPAEVQSILNVLAAEVDTVGKVLAAAPLSTSDAKEMKAQAFADVLRKYTDRSKAYVNAIATANASGIKTINAPGLKDFIIGSMRAISDAYVTATVLQCRQTWVESILDRAYKAMSAIGGVAYGIGGVVVGIGEAVVSAADSTARILGFLIKAAPFAAVGLGALILYKIIKQRGVTGLVPDRFPRLPNWMRPKRFRDENVSGLFLPPGRH